jgi:hypothetical protein
LAWLARRQPKTAVAKGGKEIVHDAEYYVVEAQNGKVWAAEDQDLDKKLAELR